MLHDGSATPAPGSCQPAGHDGLSLTALADARGISKDAARRLVKAGKVSAHQVAGTHGPKWCVHPDETVLSGDHFRHGGASPAPGLRNGSAGDAPGVHHGPVMVAPAPELSTLVALVDRLTVENRQLAEAAAVWQERARMLADQLALAAPQPPVEAPGAMQEPAPTTDAPAPWYRRWRSWLLTPFSRSWEWIAPLVAVVVAVALLTVLRS